MMEENINEVETIEVMAEVVNDIPVLDTIKTWGPIALGVGAVATAAVAVYKKRKKIAAWFEEKKEAFEKPEPIVIDESSIEIK